MGNGHPFEMGLYRDYLNDYCVFYIFIVCFFYGIFAVLSSNKFIKSGIFGQIVWMFLIIVLTILTSLPFGGILTYYLDMSSGYFPDNWFYILLTKGISDGILSGWFFIVISFPYNILCAVGGYFLTKAGSKYFQTK
jgi:membrane protein YqaA with SNARE-associated domain